MLVKWAPGCNMFFWWVKNNSKGMLHKKLKQPRCVIKCVNKNHGPTSLNNTEVHLYYTQRLRQNGQHFSDDIFKCIFNETHFNPLHAKFFRGNIKHVFTCHVIPLHWFDTGGWNPSSNKTRTYPFYIVNIMAAAVLATQGARTSAAMILT